MKFDIVYPLGNGSQWNDSELRYSLRAIQRNLKGVQNIVIVGRCPDFIDKSKVIFIPADDPLPSNADGNIALKVLKVCDDPRISEDFLFINDDHIINSPMHISEIGYYHKGNFEAFKKKYWHTGLHRSRLRRTFEVLRQKGYTTFHFDLHTPIRINKTLFKKYVPQFDFQFDIGYTMKSIYANPAIPNELKEYIGDRKVKIFEGKTFTQLTRIFNEAMFISYNDFGLNGELKYFLSQRYPRKCKYELFDKNKEPSEIIREYLAKAKRPLNHKMYNDGVDLFRQYGKNANLLWMFQRKHTEHTEEKLLYKLQAISEHF